MARRPGSASRPAAHSRVSPAITLLVLAACFLAPGRVSSRSAVELDSVFSIEGSLDAWSVSRGGAGCFLLSPFRRAASRLAMGSHSKHGFGLYAVGFAMSVSMSDPTAPVLVRAGEREVAKVGRMVAPALIFVPLSRAEAGVSLQELRKAGTLWLSIRGTWVAHSGRDIVAAADLYEKDCAGDGAD